MASVVSATTGSVYGAGARVSRADQFLAAAESLIAQAHDDFEAGRHDLAMENAYRAAPVSYTHLTLPTKRIV